MFFVCLNNFFVNNNNNTITKNIFFLGTFFFSYIKILKLVCNKHEIEFYTFNIFL